jgi:hypothetical protein
VSLLHVVCQYADTNIPFFRPSRRVQCDELSLFLPTAMCAHGWCVLGPYRAHKKCTVGQTCAHFFLVEVLNLVSKWHAFVEFTKVCTNLENECTRRYRNSGNIL